MFSVDFTTNKYCTCRISIDLNSEKLEFAIFVSVGKERVIGAKGVKIFCFLSFLTRYARCASEKSITHN